LFKRFLYGFFSVNLILSVSPLIASASVFTPTINAEYGATIDVFSGDLLYGKNENVQAYPASITKVLTAIIVDEHLSDDDTITISDISALQEPSNNQLLMKSGDVLSKEDALEMLMLISSNDVAYALAETVSGSIEEFSILMNKKAEELGAKNTHFVTPNGLPNPEHKTTAYDMALFGREITKHPFLMEIMAKTTADIVLSDRTINIHSKHKIFESNFNGIAGKTGWTKASGNTLLVISKDGDKEVVSVVLKTSSADASYKDIKTLVDYSFPLFKSKKFFSKGDVITSFKIKNRPVSLIANRDIRISFKDEEKIKNRIIWEKKEEFSKSEVAAWLAIYGDDGKEIERFPLIVDSTVSISDNVKDTQIIPSSIQDFDYKRTIFILLIILFVPSFLFSLFYKLTHRKPRKNT
jgi:D-alanyl-D-alanine carboxypeptidase